MLACVIMPSKCRQLKLKPTVLASLTLLQNYVIYFRRQDELRMEDEDDTTLVMKLMCDNHEKCLYSPEQEMSTV